MSGIKQFVSIALLFISALMVDVAISSQSVEEASEHVTVAQEGASPSLMMLAANLKFPALSSYGTEAETSTALSVSSAVEQQKAQTEEMVVPGAVLAIIAALLGIVAVARRELPSHQ